MVLFGTPLAGIGVIIHGMCRTGALAEDRTANSIGHASTRSWDEAFAQRLQAGILARLFEGNLTMGNTELAYSITSEEFQRRHSLQEFVAMVEMHRELQWRTTLTLGEELAENCSAYKVTKEADDGSQFIFKFRLIRENEEWKVDEVIWP